MKLTFLPTKHQLTANRWAGEQQKGKCAHNWSWLHTFRRAYCFMRANGWVGEQGKGRRPCNFCDWGRVLESTQVCKSMWVNSGGRETTVVRVNTSRLLLPTGVMGEEVVPEALFSQKGVDYMSSKFDCITYKLYILLYMCFSISPYVWLCVPAYLGTRGLIEHCFFFVSFFV
jgi:hypothetical protein